MTPVIFPLCYFSKDARRGWEGSQLETPDTYEQGGREVVGGRDYQGSFWVWRPGTWPRERRSRRRDGGWERRQEADGQMKEVKGQKREPLLLGGVFAVPSSQMDRKRARARWPPERES